MKKHLEKLRYLNILLLLIIVFNSFSVMQHNYEFPNGTQGILGNYRIFIITLLILEILILKSYWSVFLRMGILGKAVYVISFIYILSILKLCNLTSFAYLRMEHKFIFSLMRNSYPLIGITISFAVFFLLSISSKIWIKTDTSK
jgi:hypothetical protein